MRIMVATPWMLATIIMVIWHRRVTLRQINANLRRISEWLKVMEGNRAER